MPMGPMGMTSKPALRALLAVFGCAPAAHTLAQDTSPPAESQRVTITSRSGVIDCTQPAAPGQPRAERLTYSSVSLQYDPCLWLATTGGSDAPSAVRLYRAGADVSCELEVASLPGPVDLPEDAYVEHLRDRGIDPVVVEASTTIEIDGVPFRHQSLKVTMPADFDPAKPRFAGMVWYRTEARRMVTLACFGPDAAVEALRPQIRHVAESLRLDD